MKASELRDQTPEQLRAKLLDLKKEQFNLRFQAANGQDAAQGRIRAARRGVARVKTVLNEKVRAAANA